MHETALSGQASRRVAIVMNGAFALVRFRGSLIDEMVRRGATVFALAPDFDAKTRAAVEDLGACPVDYHLERKGLGVINELSTIRELSGIFRRLEIDTTLGCFIKPAIYGTIAAWLAGVPNRFAMIEGLGFVFTHDGAPVRFSRRALSQIVKGMMRLGLQKAERIFVLNADDRQFMLRHGIAHDQALVDLPGTGIDLARFAAAEPVTSPMIFLMVARLLREKGVFEFAEAARLVRRHHPQARFVLVGGLDDNPGAIKEETVRSWVKKEILEWTGHVDDIVEQLARASVFVLPSWREGAPRSTQEALALGRPVITTDAPGARDTVEDGVNGFLVPVRDPGALAAAAIRFIENPALVASMGTASRNLAERRFDEISVNTRILQTLKLTESIWSETILE